MTVMGKEMTKGKKAALGIACFVAVITGYWVLSGGNVCFVIGRETRGVSKGKSVMPVSPVQIEDPTKNPEFLERHLKMLELLNKEMQLAGKTTGKAPMYVVGLGAYFADMGFFRGDAALYAPNFFGKQVLFFDETRRLVGRGWLEDRAVKGGGGKSVSVLFVDSGAKIGDVMVIQEVLAQMNPEVAVKALGVTDPDLVLFSRKLRFPIRKGRGVGSQEVGGSGKKRD